MSSTDDRHDQRSSRRVVLAMIAAGAGASILRSTDAQTSSLVPPRLQASLMAKVAAYDRRFAARAGDRAKLLLIGMPDDPESMRTVVEMKNALASIETVGGLHHEEEVVPFSDAASIARSCRANRIAIVYFGPGFSKELASIRAALTSVDVLSVGGVPDYVPNGVVLGFNLVSGNAKLLVNLTQARAQNVELEAKVPKLMTVYE